MAMVRLLVELYQTADLRLNLKFEIEVLLKALKMDIKTVEPSNILKTRHQGRAAALAVLPAGASGTGLLPPSAAGDKFDLSRAAAGLAGSSAMFPGATAAAGQVRCC